MPKCATVVLVGVLLSLFAVQSAAAQDKAHAKQDLNVLIQIPHDAIVSVVVPGGDRTAKAVKEMVVDVLGPAGKTFAESFKPMEMVLGETPFGKGLDPSGSGALVILDPRTENRAWVAGRSSDEQPPDTEEAFEQYPWALVLPVKDAQTFFDPEQIDVRKQGDLYRINDGQGWARQVAKHMVLAPRKETLERFPAKVNVMTRMTRAHEKMIARDHLWVLADWKKLMELRKAKLLPELKHSLHMFTVFTAQILPLRWVYMTRSENLSEATQMAAGVHLDGQAVRVEARWSYPEGSHMAKSLQAFTPPKEPLIRRLPSAPGMFAYGADKSFRSPQALKSRQYRKAMGFLKELFVGFPSTMKNPEEHFDKLADETIEIVSVLQEQVQSVEHWLGTGLTDKQSICLGTTVRVRDAAKVLDLAPKIPATITKAFGTPLPYKLTSKPREDLSGGGVKVIEVTAATAGDDKPIELPEQFSKMLGDKHFRVLVASVGKDTIVTTFGGGQKALSKMIEISRSQKSFEMPEAWAKTARMLPANRAVEFFISPADVWDFFTSSMMGGGNSFYRDTLGAFPTDTPAGCAVAIDGLDMSIVAVVPYDIPRGAILMQQRLSGPEPPEQQQAP
jgi:hypothetical protein